MEQAVANGYSVKILYHKSGEKQLNYRSVDPYRIIYWNNKWYVIGFCHLRNDIRSFKVDRIESLIQTENKFNRPDNFSASDFFIKSLLPCAPYFSSKFLKHLYIFYEILVASNDRSWK